jgi:hypothetical protein
LEDFYDNDKTIAFVYLSSKNDDNNKIMISDEHLQIVYRKKKYIYPIQSLKILKTEKVKFLFPLVLGGIMTPFAFLAYFINPYYPWVHLLAILLGMFLFYLGLYGKDSFTVVKRGGEEIRHFLPYVSKNLEAFIDFANPILREKKALQNGLYFKVDKIEEKLLFGERKADQSIFPLFGYTYIQFRKNSQSFLEENYCCINPAKTQREISFKFDPKSKMMRPVLEGPVPRDAQIKSG